MFKQMTEELLDFIQKSPSCYHAVENTKKILDKNGFCEVSEGKVWELQEGGKYYVIRNCSSIIAFKIPSKNFKGFNIVASHSDAPTFKIKENYQIEVDNKLVKLNVEKYGGMIFSSWFDRPLSIAGKVVVKEGNKFVSRLVNIDRDLVVIPNLAIHFNRNINDGYKYNAQNDMLPLYGDISSKDTLMKLVAENVGVAEEDILGSDLFLYNRMNGSIWGANQEFMSSPKLDDLQCAFSSLKGFLAGENKDAVQVHAVFDNEEVGSLTKQGAESTFLLDTLNRINSALGRTQEDYLTAVANSFMISADNAHAVHPNHPQKSDQTNRPYMNEGIVIKFNANQKYTTDSMSAAVFKSICEDASVPYQVFTNRSDAAGGSTLGNISNSKVSLNTVDIGLPQLAMHSAYETGGIKDTYYLVKALESFYSTSIVQEECGVLTINKTVLKK
ncbi:MAG: M18 family aminopeptidase [Intestinibacter sp.]|uniref:M18 family aminopeptidase n=1 Tax=Intestinibacter sp. TaxID=1965304 RepID=UPI002A83052B|nr:M18 family aminopeptidase [Intestinibacter sp.]MDY4574561.1 M18 family aminopeptidase [Intestinibacter sp.]